MVAERGGKNLSSLPFPAIVEQDELKRVLLSVAANDGLDGALIVGEKGTAKSTAVRGLVDLLPQQRAVADCPYGCDPDDRASQCASCRNRDPDDLPVETRPVPLVTLPLGATRDRVVGTLSVADALSGEADFDPGLLARAHRGILYVDEVNLLEDHLVDVLLDAAARGVNTVERDGVSLSHPAEFTLVGTMNPEEGDLRPQLRDRFALQASVTGCRDVDDRVEVIDRALEDGSGDADLRAEYADDVDRLRTDLLEARERLPRVDLPTEFKREIADLCLEAGVDGHRGDVAIARTAMTLATLEGRTTVIEPDVHEATSYALPHRLRATPFEDEPDLDDLLEDRFDESASNGSERQGTEAETGDGDEMGDDSDETGDGTSRDSGEDTAGDADSDGRDSSDPDGRPGTSPDHSDRDSDGSDRRSETADEPVDEPEPLEASGAGTFGGDDSRGSESDNVGNGDSEDDDESAGDEDARPLVPGQRRGEVAGVGEARAPDLETPTVDSYDSPATGGDRVSAVPTVDNRGARVRTEPASEGDPIDAAASIRSAAARGRSQVERRDLRRSVRTGETSTTIVFAVDASASMRPAMRAAKGVVLELLHESYERRDRVAFVAFAGEDADVLLPPTESVGLAARHLKDLPSGDRTPLPAGLETARTVVERTETDAAVVVLVTDGRATVADASPTETTREAAFKLARSVESVVVVDAGDDSRVDLIPMIVDETDGTLVGLSALTAERVRSAVDRAVGDR
ncbi:VWA domain-containing protein [Natrialba sp. INN-245]|uniref:VWA domain-containing protein n=1 Tax=Natrialba sp. INN-245 TaxID=2690967 RepID=UPI0013102B5F|nr:VWA domain-containing protein [Natrialba sp. INN-245]MWV40001.1 VWA domain-containing protein [Natrialba sp. INN-245]